MTEPVLWGIEFCAEYCPNGKDMTEKKHKLRKNSVKMRWKYIELKYALCYYEIVNKINFKIY